MVKKIVDVDNLSTKEKLQAMEELWSSLSEAEFNSPEWHKEILDERTQKVSEGRATYITLNELKNRFK